MTEQIKQPIACPACHARGVLEIVKDAEKVHKLAPPDGWQLVGLCEDGRDTSYVFNCGECFTAGADPVLWKLQVLNVLFDRFDFVEVYVDVTNNTRCVVPAHLAGTQFMLHVGFRLPHVPVSDLRLRVTGLSATLSFAREPFHCIIPWECITAATAPNVVCRFGSRWFKPIKGPIEASPDAPSEEAPSLRHKFSLVPGGKA